MNILTNILSVFIFIIIILFYGIIDLDNNNFILHKVILFGALFCFQYAVMLLSKFKDGCKVDYNEIFNQGVETAVVGVIGYSIYNDLRYSDIAGVSDDVDNKVKYVYITVIITLMLTFINSIKLLFGYTPYECVRKKKKKLTGQKQA